MLSLSTRDLAKHCFVSIATIYRFLEKLEIKGYSEFKAALSVALVTQKEEEEFNFNFPIQAKETPFKVVQMMKEDYLQTIHTTIDMLDLETLRQAVGAMRQAQVIDVYLTYFSSDYDNHLKKKEEYYHHLHQYLKSEH